MRRITSVAMALGLLAAPVVTGRVWAAAGPTQTNATGPITVAVTPLPHTAGEPLALKVVLDTHSVDLDAIAVERVVAVRTAAGPVTPARIESAKGSGHHREAVLLFAPSALAPGAASLEVVVKDVGGVAERLFRWDLPLKTAQAAAPEGAPQAGPMAGAGASGAGTMAPGAMGPGGIGGGMMGEMGPMGGGATAPGTGAARPGPGAMPDMAKMMERMAELQKRMSDVTGAPR